MDYFEDLKEGPPQLETHGGFPSEPAEHLGSFRVTNKNSEQEVPETLVKYIKFTFFWMSSIHVLFVSMFLQSLSGGGVVRLKIAPVL